MRGLRSTAVAVLASIVVLTVAACGTDATTGDASRPATPTSSAPVDPPTGSPSEGQRSSRPGTRSTEGDGMRVQITIGEQHFQATLDDSAASRDLAARLPLTVEMSDHGGVEKTGRLPSPLSLDGQPAGADPDVGDVGYYAPANDLVLYYGDQSYYDGIVVLGRMHDDAAERIAAMEGSITVQLQR
ncbi:cyclophilin-like protein [Kribbella sp. VKM Ac-2568]|nr:cyclophilin-like protein [Kribbella sp. VKM Ac-2568]